MRTQSRFRSRAHKFTSIVCLTLMTSCTTWKTQSRPAAEVVRREHPDAIRVTLMNGEMVQLSKPEVVSDGLRGIVPRLGADGPKRVTYPLDQIRFVSTEGTSTVATIGLVLGATAGLVALLGSSGGSDYSPTPSGSTMSCPSVYSWDGRDWLLDSGTFGGAITRGLQRTDVDNLDYARAFDGQVRLRLQNDLQETDHVDALTLVAVDHPAGTSVSPGPDGQLHGLGTLTPPLSARDHENRDVLARVRTRDNWSWESRLATRDVTRAGSLRDGIELEFARPAGTTLARLVIDAHNTPWSAWLLAEMIAAHGRDTEEWYRALDSDPEGAQRMQNNLAAEAFLRAELLTERGWQHAGLAWEAGPEIVKRQVLPIDLALVTGDRVRIRLDAPPSFWLIDAAHIDFGPEPPFSTTAINAHSAIDHTGRDVGARLQAVDDHVYTLETGDFADLEFHVPPTPPGATRSYLVRSTGWYRIQVPAVGDPDQDVLHSLATEPGASSRLAVTRMNQALARMNTAPVTP